MSSAVVALDFPAVLSSHRQSVSVKSTHPCSRKQIVCSCSSRVVRHTSENGYGTRKASSSLDQRRPFGGGSKFSRENDVSAKGRTANPFQLIRCCSRRGSRIWVNRKSNSGAEVFPSLISNKARLAAFVSRDRSPEAPSPYLGGDGNEDSEPLSALPSVEVGAQQESENSLRTGEEIVGAAVPPQRESTEVSSEDNRSLPTMQDIIATAAQEGVKLQVNSFGPTFQIKVTNLAESQVFGTADGWIKWWWPKGKILHLESVTLERGLSKQVGNVFGAGFFVGAATLRYGFDQGCQTAELLAIYDDEVTHSKLVKYYSRIGFTTLYEVNDEEIKSFPDRVVWGGVGTRMDADCEKLLRKWRAVLRPKSRSRSGTKGLSSRAPMVQ